LKSLASEGWHHWLSTPPPQRILIEIGYLDSHCDWYWCQITYADVPVIAPSRIGLYWRMTGIGREQLAAQAFPNSHPWGKKSGGVGIYMAEYEY
jgi:hypothetical protein